jgi:mono/diheme cytochrome c family protein
MERRRTGRAAISVVLLLGGVAGASAQQSRNPPADTREGHRLFVQSCAVCHLKPSPTADTYGPPLSQETVDGRQADVRDLIAKGSERMPAFRYDLEPAQIDAIVAYLATVPAAPPTSSSTTPSAGGMPR